MILAATVAVAASACYGVGSACQQREAARSSVPGQLDMGALARLALRRLWLVGLLLDGLGLGLHVAALGLGPVSLVQPLEVPALLFALLAASWWSRRLPGRGQVLAGGCVTAGVAGFLLLSRPGQSRHVLSVTSCLVLAGCGLAGAAGLAWAGRGRSGPVRAMLLGMGAGGGFAVTAVLLGSLSLLRQHAGLAGLDQPRGLAALGGVLATGAAAIVVNQAAFQVGDLAAALPAVTLLDPVLAVVLGWWLLGERLAGGAWSGLGVLLAVVLGGGGVLALAGHRPAAGADDPEGWRSGEPSRSPLSPRSRLR